MDVVTTPDLLRLRTYSIKACYQFHGFRLHEERAVRLRPGLRGTVISYWDPRDGRDWSTLSWEQPVRTDGGGTAYERVVLMVVDTRSYVLPELARNRTGLAPTVTGVVSGRSEATRLAAGGRLLEDLARDVVTNQERRGESSDGVVRTTRQEA
jgi:hypothetical protein